MDIDHTEREDGGTAQVLLANYDQALNSLDFEQFKAVLSYGYFTGTSRSAWAASTAYSLDDIRIPTTANTFQYRCTTAGTSHSSEPTFPTDLGVTVTETGGVVWEMDGLTGVDYSATAPLYVVDNPLLSSADGHLIVGLTLEGVLNRMARDRAEVSFQEFDGSVQTVKDLITAICDTTIRFSTVYGNYPAITVVFDSEDSLFDTFQPKDLFRIRLNDSRLDRIKYLLSFTGMKMRVEADGKIHFFDPTITGTSYDYEYKLLVSGEHTFLNKEIRNRFVDPNKFVVRSHPSHIPQYSGSATSATSFALYPTTRTLEGRFISNAQCDAIAGAVIEQAELDAESGSGKFTMNCGAEPWDWIKITDSRQNDSVTGNVRGLRRKCRMAGGDTPGVYDMRFAFGKEARGLSGEALLGQIPSPVTPFQETGFVSWPVFNLLLTELDATFKANQLDHAVFRSVLQELIDGFNNLSNLQLIFGDEVVFRKVTVTEQLIVPTEEP